MADFQRKNADSGAYLRLKSVLKGMSDADVASALGVSRAAVSQWKTGATRPDWVTLLRASEMAECSFEWLLTGDPKYLKQDRTKDNDPLPFDHDVTAALKVLALETGVTFSDAVTDLVIDGLRLRGLYPGESMAEIVFNPKKLNELIQQTYQQEIKLIKDRVVPRDSSSVKRRKIPLTEETYVPEKPRSQSSTDETATRSDRRPGSGRRSS